MRSAKAHVIQWVSKAQKEAKFSFLPTKVKLSTKIELWDILFYFHILFFFI